MTLGRLIPRKPRQHKNCEYCKNAKLFNLDDKVFIHGKYYSKEQILSNKEIVERLKEEYDKVNRFPWMGDITTGIKNGDLVKIFKSILETGST